MDIIRLISGGLFALIACYIGVMIKRRYKERENFFRSAHDFALKLKGELSYLKTPLPDVAQRFLKSDAGSFSKLLAQVLDNKKAGDEREMDMPGFLKQDEKELVREFLCADGKLSVNEQLALNERYLHELEAKLSLCESETKKKGGMYFKLCALIGIAIILILV